MNVRDRVLERIRPDDNLKNEVSSTSHELILRIKALASIIDGVVDVRLVGSVAKDTYVGKPDIDVFILFDPSVLRKDMDRIGITIGNSVLSDKEERYAEHPYVHGRFDGFEADVVPCYKIADTKQKMSAVDRTPFHTEYVISRLKEGQRDEVRLLKQFLKGIGAYGAEAKTQGFSGYLVELLVIKYGTFEEAVSAGSTWRVGEKLDIDGKGSKRFQSPMTFFDPVDLSRNVASALSMDKFSLFVHACKEYRASENVKFFFPQARRPLNEDEVRSKVLGLGHPIILASCPRPDLIDDNLYPQAWKTLEGLAVQMSNDDFQVLDMDLAVTNDEIVFGLMLESDVLSPTRKHVGPPVTMGNAEVFLARWKGEAKLGPYIENGRWVALVERPVMNADDALNKALDKASLGDSFKSGDIKVVSFKNGMKGGHLECATRLLDKRMSWEV